MPNSKLDVAAGAPNPESYTDDGDGTITDNVTGLMWQHTVSTASYTLTEATQYCATLTLGGYNDWRIPTRIQLVSIVDSRKSYPRIDTTTFLGTDAAPYWTSSRPAIAPSNVFLLDFYGGTTFYASAASSVGLRCVRNTRAVVSTGISIAGPAAPGRYTYPTAGTVYDTATALTWQRIMDSSQYNWAHAKDYCTALGATLGGLGWRLPTMTELQTLVDESRSDPCIDPTAFDGGSAFVWTSSSPLDTDPTEGSVVNFRDGTLVPYNLTYYANVRCVR